MAKKKENDNLEAMLDDLSKKSSLAVFGADGELEQESDAVKGIIRQSMKTISKNLSRRTPESEGNLNYFTKLSLTSAFLEAGKEGKLTADDKADPDRAFKRYMENQEVGDIQGILSGETARIVSMSNYDSIFRHIPECAQALETYKDNILSPDDFTKIIFDADYEDESNREIKTRVEEQIKELIEKYELEELTDQIIEGTLLYGEQYIVALSLEDEMDLMLTDPDVINSNYSGRQLNENVLFDAESYDILIESEDINFSSEELNEAFQDVIKEDKDVDVKQLKEEIVHMINTNVQIGSKKELILERIEAERHDIYKKELKNLPKLGQKGVTDAKAKKDDKPMYINGSSVKVLDPSKVVELSIDNVDYGIYYLQDGMQTNVPNSGYLGPSTGREVLSPANIGSNNVSVNNTKLMPRNNEFTSMGLSDAKVNLIAKIFLDVISKKVDKEFIRHNKDFKDFLYNLIKQDYILKKEIRMTYFAPNEYVKFKADALFRKIVFFAKLYMAMLTNTLLIKMGRSHDKRVFYVDTGLGKDYEQAVNRVLQDVKTKEFKMDSITGGEINTIINLNPGKFDDYYIPTMGGDKSIEIDTLAGMDADLRNDFLEYLNDKMMAGIGIPTALIDATKELEFARQLSAQNGNFVRSVVKYQKRLTKPFNQLVRKLYKNEYRFNDDSESDIEDVVNIDSIKVSFPSPMYLRLENTINQINSVREAAEFYSSTLVPEDQSGTNDRRRMLLKNEMIKDMLPGADWEKYGQMLKEIEPVLVEEKLKDSPTNEEEDPYGAGGGLY